MFCNDDCIEVFGAREHNLKNIDVVIPRNKLVVITGLSGSGKSSLAFDTIFAEGQRRYIESFSSYARQFIGELKRPDVDKINGLSPVISIEQKTTNKNPRSTVGTVTEIYDFLRLFYARAADAYSYNTGNKMVQYTEQKIIDQILDKFNARPLLILAPLVKARKGHYRELFEQLAKKGYVKVRVDGNVVDITQGMAIDRYKIHDIELVVDRLIVGDGVEERLRESIREASKQGKGNILVLDSESNVLNYFSKNLMCPDTGIAYQDPEPNTFSFNSPYGACPHCNGLGFVSMIDENKIIPDKNLSIRDGAILPIGKHKSSWIFKQIEAIGEKYGFTLDTPVSEISEEGLAVVLNGSDEVFKINNDNLGVYANYSLSYNGIVAYIEEQDNEEASSSIKRWIQGFMEKSVCPVCDGARLKKESLFFKVDEKNISQLANMDISVLYQWFEGLEKRLSEKQNQIAFEILKEIRSRLKFMLNVGMDYVTLNRPFQTLSGGESQRIRLATQIGSDLVNVLYILDEPSIGLHPKDNDRLINSLKELRDKGNSVIVVEHDEEMMRQSDYIIDLGPGAGAHGGFIVGKGAYADFIKSDSLTSQYLKSEKNIVTPAKRREGNGKFLELKGAAGNNLKNVDVKFPLGKMICITGVSGSGKSTLINETLYPILSQHFYRSIKNPLQYRDLIGIDAIDKVVEIDQSPIGRTPRSNPATYTKVFDEIRKLYSDLPESKIRGYKPGRFSFNVKGGRCETCQGAGLKVIEMNFLPDVYVECEACHGHRYNRETLEVRYKGKSINDVLELTIDNAVEFFESIPFIVHKIKTLQEVGLGYIKLGQQSTTLSGGEAQRVKLATELSKKDTGNTLYILDEPTTGLHFEDVRILLEVLSKLVDRGNTVIIIEHNLDVVKSSDYIIDMGLDGGSKGGSLLFEGTPEQLSSKTNSYTAKYLKKVL
ncbi:MAG: excinuclease ABC subunit UvrA [Bacteroidota bacterium]